MLFTFPKSVEGLKQALKEKVRPRHRNKAYLQSYRDKVCFASDNGVDMCLAPAIGAHIRVGHEGGGSLKPDDSLTHPLCDRHHKIQHECIEDGAEAWFIVQYIYKPMMRRMFLQWYGEHLQKTKK